MCIYYTDRTDLNYDSPDHVFPAALGGKRKLPADYVSKEFNTDISTLEGEVIHESILAMPREIEGPGKRGKLGERHATKSEIFVFGDSEDESLIALGYIKVGTGYEIPQVIYDTKTGFGHARGTDVDGLIRFKDDCKNIDIKKLRIIINNKLPENKILFGIQKGIEKKYDYFFAKNEANPIPINESVIKQLGEGINTDETAKTEKYQPVFSRKAIFDINHFRFHAKIAFNFLALRAGKDYVLDTRFNPLREWISKGGENHFANFSPKGSNPLELLNIKLPDSYHLVYIIQVKEVLWAKVYLYGLLGVDIALCKNFDDGFRSQAFICDWKNQKEYELYEYLQMHGDLKLLPNHDGKENKS